VSDSKEINPALGRYVSWQVLDQNV